MGLNKHELATIAATNPDQYEVEIKRSDDGFWHAIITLTQTSVDYEIVTARGDVKTWRNLEDALLFIQNTCPECKSLEVKMGTWTLVRKSP